MLNGQWQLTPGSGRGAPRRVLAIYSSNSCPRWEMNQLRRLAVPTRRAAVTLACLALVSISAAPRALPAQIIDLKTTPLAGSDQFTFYPSTGLGITGVSIAIDDSLHDPFTNPAKGKRLNRA